MHVDTTLAIFALPLSEEVAGLGLGLFRCVRNRWGFGRCGWSLVRLGIRSIYGCVAENSWEIFKPKTELGEFGMSGIIPHKGHLLTVVPVRDEFVDVAYTSDWP